MRELFVAFAASVALCCSSSVFRGSISGVRLHVSPQIGSVGEGLAAMGASVRLLTRVRPQMALQQPRPGEGFVANVAFVAEVMGEEMHGERRHGHVDLVAMRALLSALGVQVPMSLLVAREIGGCGVRFTAFVARVSLLELLLLLLLVLRLLLLW